MHLFGKIRAEILFRLRFRFIQEALIITSCVVFSAPTKAFAQGGHGDEFKAVDTQPKDAIQVDANTAKQIGIKVETVISRQLELDIKTNGQIEAIPHLKVEITTPTKGQITQLLVKLGDRNNNLFSKSDR